jgi:hypothetical protein
MLIRQWTEQEIADLKQMYPDMNISFATLEEHFGRRRGTIKQQARRYGLRRPPQRIWTQEETEVLKSMYTDEDISHEQIESYFDRTWKSINHKAHALGLRRPHPNTRQAKRDFFKVIDTDEKAYWLGFIAADGVVVCNGRQYSVVLDLQPRDLHWLERFRDMIAPGATMTKHGSRSYSVCIGSKEMVQDVMAYGIGPRKSNTLPWPSIPETFVLPFLLSYFDGDGWMRKRTDRGNWLWGLTGTQSFLTVARDYIQHYANVVIAAPVRHCKDRSPHLYRITATSQRAIAIDRTLNASGLGMPRKHLMTCQSTENGQ